MPSPTHPLSLVCCQWLTLSFYSRALLRGNVRHVVQALALLEGTSQDIHRDSASRIIDAMLSKIARAQDIDARPAPLQQPMSAGQAAVAGGGNSRVVDSSVGVGSSGGHGGEGEGGGD